ncbi:hypothetical protein QCA50_012582 [Cerrena zonata]|uniref:C2H2-type domain-containing protein n=1 Tax=Cerrena zonata TaxID=2478898 RepID=A0AAW0G2V4_9APHY
MNKYFISQLPLKIYTNVLPSYQAIVDIARPMISAFLGPDTSCLMAIGSRASGHEFIGNERLELLPSQIGLLEEIISGTSSLGECESEEDDEADDFVQPVHYNLQDIEDQLDYGSDVDIEGEDTHNRATDNQKEGGTHDGNGVGAGQRLHEGSMNMLEYTSSKESTPQPGTSNIWTLNELYRFNGYYLICRICDNVVPFSHAPTHSKSSGQRMSQFQDKSNRYHTERHNTVHSKTCSDDELHTQLLNKLQELGFHQCDVLDQPGDVSKNSSKWLQSAPFKDVLKLPQDNLDPTITPISPIPGLPVYKAYRCDNCRYLSLHWETFLKNHSGKHAACRNRIDNIVTVQSLSTAISSMRLFMVTEPPKELAAESESNLRSSEILLRSQTGILALQTLYRPPQDLHPCLQDTGILPFLHQFDINTIDELMDVRKIDPRLRILVETCLDQDRLACTAFGFDKETLYSLVDNGLPLPPKSPFRPPNQQSHKKYVIEAELFLHVALQHIKAPTKSRDNKTELFVLSAEQQNHLQGLSNALASDNYLDEAKQSLYQCLLSIFFMPHKSQHVQCVFLSPIIAFFAARVAQPRTGVVRIEDVVPLISKIIYLMRLVPAHIYFQKLSDDDSTSTRCSPSVPAFQWLSEFCQRNLHVKRPSPFAVLRHWSATITCVVTSLKQPHRIIRNGDQLTIDGQTFSYGVYKASLMQELRDLGAIIQERILMGVSLKEAGISTRLDGRDTLDVKTPGYSPFAPADSPSDSFFKFWEIFFEMGYLGLRSSDGGVVFDVEKALDWLQDLEAAWSSWRALVHQLGGPPGPGKQFANFMIRNRSRSQHRDVLLLAPARGVSATLATLSTYHRIARSTGEFMKIYRFLPVALGEMLVILLDIVRPLETYILGVLQGSTGVGQIVNAQNYHLFTRQGKSIGSSDISHSLRNFFRKRVGIDVGLQGYRRLGDYFAKEMVMTEDIKARYARLESILNHAETQAAHTPAMFKIYGQIDTSSSFLYTPSIRLNAEICEEIHKQLGIHTYGTLQDLQGGEADGIRMREVESSGKGKAGTKGEKRKRVQRSAAAEDSNTEHGEIVGKRARLSHPTPHPSERLA